MPGFINDFNWLDDVRTFYESINIDYIPTDISVISAAADTTPDIAIAAKRQDGAGGAVFVINYNSVTGLFDLDTAEPDYDILTLGFVPNAVAYKNANIDGSAKDYIFTVGVDNIDVRYVTSANVGGTSTTDAFSQVATATFDGTARDVALYSNAAVDVTPNDEVLVFIGASTGVIGYELDYVSSQHVLQSRGNLTEATLPDLDVQGVNFDDATIVSGKAGWLTVAGGADGLYLMQTSGADDELALSFKGRIDTSGMTIKPFYMGGIINGDQIDHIYVADGGGGVKDFSGANLDLDTRAVSLIYQWDESVSAVATKLLYVNSAAYYAAILDQSGGIKLYDVNTASTAPVPVQESIAGADGKLGFDLAWSSNFDAEGTGSHLAGTAYDMFVEAETGAATTLHFFVAAGEGGVKKMQITTATTTPIFEELGAPVQSYNTPGTARGVDANQTAAGEFKVAVADGDAGVLMMDYNNSTTPNDFALSRQVALSGAGVAEDVLIDQRASSSFLHVAYGDRGLLILNTGNATFSSWANPSQENLISKDTLGGYVKKIVKGVQNTSEYYLYALVEKQDSTTQIVAIDISTPSSASVKGTYTGEPHANNLAWVQDTTNDRYYLALSSYDDTSLGSSSRVVTVNVDNPAAMKGGTTGAVYGVSGQARCVDVVDGAAMDLMVVGETQQVGTDNGYGGYVGRINMTYSGASTVTVSATANPTVLALGGTTSLNASVSGGDAPYTYGWTVSARTSEDLGVFAPETADIINPTWTAPAGTQDIYTFTLLVTDSDGNTGQSSVTVRARPTGVSVVNRIGKAGSTVTVPIEISGVATTAVDAWGLDITFDPTLLNYLSVSMPSDLVGWHVTGEQISQGKLRLAGYAEASNAVIEAGATKTLINIKFSISTSGEPGTVATVTPSAAVDDIANVSLTAGSFKLVCPGDVDGSGFLTPQDALWTFYYFLDLYALQDDEAKVGDVNNNGLVDIVDAVEIMNRFVAYGGICPIGL